MKLDPKSCDMNDSSTTKVGNSAGASDMSKTRLMVVKVKCRRCGHLCGPMILPGPEGSYYNCEKCRFALFSLTKETPTGPFKLCGDFPPNTKLSTITKG